MHAAFGEAYYEEEDGDLEKPEFEDDEALFGDDEEWQALQEEEGEGAAEGGDVEGEKEALRKDLDEYYGLDFEDVVRGPEPGAAARGRASSPAPVMMKSAESPRCGRPAIARTRKWKSPARLA